MANPLANLSNTEKAVVLAGGAGVAWFAIRQHKASTATPSASAIDPLTGLPTSEDNQPDPVTGEAYLAEAQQYGSVSAAEQALSGSGLAGGYYGTGGSGLVGTSTGASLTPANVVQGTEYATNGAWAQAVEAGLTDIGYAPTDISAALGRYLGNLSETAAQAGIVQAALAEYGPPPVGSFQVIQASATTTAAAAQQVTVPNITGDDVTNASSALQSLGLLLRPEVPAVKGKVHTVTGQSPKAGSKAAPGSTVTITYKTS